MVQDNGAKPVKYVPPYNPFRDGDPYEGVPADELPVEERSALNPYARRCTANAKHKLNMGLTWPESRCERAAMRGKTVCRVLGGAGGRPPKTGRYSTKLPTDLQLRFKEFEADSELLSLRQNLALVDVAIEKHIERLEDVFQAWYEVFAGDIPMLDEHKAMIVDKWFNLFLKLVSERRLTAEAERRRLKALSEFMTLDTAKALIAFLVDVVKTHVKDPETLAKIGDELRIVLGKVEAGPLDD